MFRFRQEPEAGQNDQDNGKNTHTAEHDITRPSISIPASAKAVLAATTPEEMHPSILSVSITVIKTSTVDLGKSSNRTDGTRAWCMATAMDLSSASWFQCS